METADLAMEIVNGELATLIDAIAPYATGDHTEVAPPCVHDVMTSVRFIHAGRSALEVQYHPDGTTSLLIETYPTAHDAHLAREEGIANAVAEFSKHTCYTNYSGDPAVASILAALRTL